jgi:hypothetical protein
LPHRDYDCSIQLDNRRRLQLVQLAVESGNLFPGNPAGGFPPALTALFAVSLKRRMGYRQIDRNITEREKSHPTRLKMVMSPS